METNPASLDIQIIPYQQWYFIKALNEKALEKFPPVEDKPYACYRKSLRVLFYIKMICLLNGFKTQTVKWQEK